MRLLVIGATGDVGEPVADALASRHEVLRASRNAEDASLRVDIADPESIRALFRRIDAVDGVISCAGATRRGSVTEISDEDLAYTIANKLMGQVNLVRFGFQKVRDNGVFLLTAGIFSVKPPPGAPALALVNGALESFARAAALDLPRGIRTNTISPPFLEETATRMGLKLTDTLSAVENAQAYLRLVEGRETGQVIFP